MNNDLNDNIHREDDSYFKTYQILHLIPVFSVVLGLNFSLY